MMKKRTMLMIKRKKENVKKFEHKHADFVKRKEKEMSRAKLRRNLKFRDAADGGIAKCVKKAAIYVKNF